jgi:uncharacterized SAM-binding protein YcdF (DUF218 family)
MFLFKKIISQFLFPMPVCLFLCFSGLGLLWWTKKQKAGKVLVTVGLLVLTALSYSPVAAILLRPLERQYPAYSSTEGGPISFIVVLGGGHTARPELPVTSRISDESLKRLAEGVRLHRIHPGSKLVLSGGTWLDAPSDAHVMAEAATIFGVPEGDVIIEGESLDTEAEARLVKPIVATNRFLLVTSANHMPRSMALFAKQGMRPEPAPTDHRSLHGFMNPGSLMPSGAQLRLTERAWYEYLGLIWLRLRPDP